jgi:hypothetical protein
MYAPADAISAGYRLLEALYRPAGGRDIKGGALLPTTPELGLKEIQAGGWRIWDR